jgi:hypothetical protein
MSIECENCGDKMRSRYYPGNRKKCSQCGRMVCPYCYEKEHKPGCFCHHGNPPIRRTINMGSDAYIEKEDEYREKKI